MNTEICTNDIDIDELKNIIDYHEKLFGVKSDLSDEIYLGVKHEMFDMINLFTLLDDDFEDLTLSLLLKDILSLILHFDTLDNQITESKNKNIYKEYISLRSKIVPIINTKLYYLDLYVWKKVENSISVQFYLRQKFSFPVHHIFDFLTYREGSFQPAIQMKYNFKDIDLKVEYDDNDLDIINSLDIFIDRRKNELLRKLIDSKHAIPFFRKMKPYDIKFVVKNIEFLRYNRGEVILSQGERSKEVYLVLLGTCSIRVDDKAVAVVEKNQLFGEFSCILNEPRTATVVSLDSVAVIRFNFAFELFDLEPHPFTILYKNIIDELIKKIAKSNKRR